MRLGRDSGQAASGRNEEQSNQQRVPTARRGLPPTPACRPADSQDTGSTRPLKSKELPVDILVSG